MEIDKDEVRKYKVKGGKTILGKLFAYQERTGLAPKEILKLPYIQFVLGMLDAPQVDYGNEKEKKKIGKLTPKEEMAAIANIFR